MTTLKKDPKTQRFSRCVKPARRGLLTCNIHSEFENMIGNVDKTFEEEKPNRCPVCMDDIAEEINSLDCGHWVHRVCVVESGKKECPICRVESVFSYEDLLDIMINHDKHSPEEIDDIPPDFDRDDGVFEYSDTNESMYNHSIIRSIMATIG